MYCDTKFVGTVATQICSTEILMKLLELVKQFPEQGIYKDIIINYFVFASEMVKPFVTSLLAENVFSYPDSVLLNIIGHM